MRHFELEKYFSKWEFTARHHMTASDMESMTLSELRDMASVDDRAGFDDLWLGYTETWGALDLREQVAETYEQMTAQNILCLAGAGEGIYAAMRVLLDKKDHVIVIVPNYQSAETIPLDICQVSGVRVHQENNWRLDIKDVEAAIRPDTRLISINYPQNPTGSVMPPDDLDALVALCRKHGIYLFSDEVYRGIELNDADRMAQIADVYEKGISLNVLSKAYGLPGLRIGWVASQDRDALQKMERYKHYLSICNSAPSERLAIIVLKNREKILDRNRAIVRENTQALDAFFADFAALFEWQLPQGGCVAFPKYIGADGVEQFCKSLIEDSGVLLLPSSIYRSELMSTPTQNFRIGFGRITVFNEGLKALRTHVETKYADVLG